MSRISPHRGRWLPRGGLWSHRDFLLLWTAQGISAIGSRITRTALPIAAILAAGLRVAALWLVAARRSLPADAPPNVVR